MFCLSSYIQNIGISTRNRKLLSYFTLLFFFINSSEFVYVLTAHLILDWTHWTEEVQKTAHLILGMEKSIC